MKRKSILMISHSSNKTGGGEMDFQRLLEYFNSRNYYIISVFPDGYKSEYFKSLSNEYLILPDNIFPFNAFNIFKYIYFVYMTIQKLIVLLPFLNGVKRKIDACFVNSSSCLSEIIGLSISGIPYTLSVKEIILPVLIRKLINNFYRRTCSEIIVISEYINNIIKKDYFGKKISIIRSSIADEDLQGIKRNSLKENNEFTILNSGVITPIKNQELLINAVQRLDTELPISINFIGRIEDEAYCEKLKNLAKSVTRKNISINFLGEVTKKQALELECNSDLLVITSKQEGMSLIVAEALYFNVPVVSTRTGVAMEVLTDGHDGLLINDNDILGLSEIINNFIKNPELCRKISENQKDIYHKYFSYSFYLKEHERILFKND